MSRIALGPVETAAKDSGGIPRVAHARRVCLLTALIAALLLAPRPAHALLGYATGKVNINGKASLGGSDVMPWHTKPFKLRAYLRIDYFGRSGRLKYHFDWDTSQLPKAAYVTVQLELLGDDAPSFRKAPRCENDGSPYPFCWYDVPGCRGTHRGRKPTCFTLNGKSAPWPGHPFSSTEASVKIPAFPMKYARLTATVWNPYPGSGQLNVPISHIVRLHDHSKGLRSAVAGTCGDGIVTADEECDPPGSACDGGSTCSTDCLCPAVPTCGDYDVNVSGEECDAPFVSCDNDDTCSSQCTCAETPTCTARCCGMGDEATVIGLAPTASPQECDAEGQQACAAQGKTLHHVRWDGQPQEWHPCAKECCALCHNRDAYHQVTQPDDDWVFQDCTDYATQWCDVGDRGGLDDAAWAPLKNDGTDQCVPSTPPTPTPTPTPTPQGEWGCCTRNQPQGGICGEEVFNGDLFHSVLSPGAGSYREVCEYGGSNVFTPGRCAEPLCGAAIDCCQTSYDGAPIDLGMLGDGDAVDEALHASVCTAVGGTYLEGRCP